MATIKPYQLKSGKVRYEVTGYGHRDKGSGKHHNFHKSGFDSWEDANDWAKQKKSDLVTEKRNGRFRRNMLLKDWLNEWIDKRKVNMKNGSMIVYRYNV